MGWSIKVKSNKSISLEDVQKVVNELPAEFAAKKEKQGWGWPCYGDILIPNGNQISIGGSASASGEHAEKFASSVANGLKKLGHEVEVSKIKH